MKEKEGEEEMTQITKDKNIEAVMIPVKEENKKRTPLLYTAFRSSSMSEEEQEGVDRMFEMMMASKQQLLLRKAFTDDQG